ncbi:HNH endonuclease signature motif containing protein [Clostridium sp. Marseille-Q2269]|uniref:HNH endonuclease signature motif containing protein n=1 Tax=Clostridium sp. Marseille-Q2269 TaxID=2942205 RepID=UPI002073DE82|nr:HNH endonuclease signature motif containing protein [Clostridium sp. Marseille-Q2269]
MPKCEVCGREGAEIHHIIHKCEGGMDLEINYKYLCGRHHRGKHSPHKDHNIDVSYKLELQNTLEKLFIKEYYSFNSIQHILNINKNKCKKIVQDLKLYKEGYKSKDIIYKLMGKKHYNEYNLFHCQEFIALGVI